MKTNYDLDALLQKALGSAEKPSPELLSKIKNEERFFMENKKNRKYFKPSVAFAAALIAALSLSVIAFAAGPMIWRNIEDRIIQGGEFVNHIDAAITEDGEMLGMRIEFDQEALDEVGEGAVIIEMEDGEIMVLRDYLQFDNLEEALALLEIDDVLMPGYLPEGFAFERAVFPINPLTHPSEPRATMHMFVDFVREENGIEAGIEAGIQKTIRMQISHHDPSWEMGVFSGSQEDITIGDNPGVVANEMLGVIIGDVKYFIDGSLTRDELIMIAESLQ